MKDTKQQMIESLNISISIASEMVDRLFERYQNGTIEKEKYYYLIEKWDNRLYDFRKQLQYQKSL